MPLSASDLVSLAGAAPWLAVSVVCLAAAAWVFRQGRRSAQAQGRRLGKLERLAVLEQTRRRQTEAWLIDHGARLPLWPPDGPRPLERDYREDYRDERDDEDLADDDLTRERPRVPPLPEFPRHRR